ncbi:DUF768 domain-containing protein [Mangrovicella endophytica]|uniref:DUF768 domain-containing protein n=1 Tax=Mangrovicella endophytica TaxID=2066697 RepID=UPI000C9EBC8C|nr:DUF768 domain-containing protein [Mangrovicella endophytica]
MDKDAKTWLEGWVAENLRGSQKDATGHISSQLIKLTADAEAAGFSEDEVRRVTGGDLESYLRGRQPER